MRSQLSAVTLCGLMAVVAWSCGSDTSEAPEGPIEPACAQYASSRCDVLERCAPTLLRLDFGTRASCEKQLGDMCLHTAALPGAALKSSAVSACASSLASSSCEQFQARVDRPFCDDAGGGTLPEGASCSSGYQCSSRACFPAASAPCGTCQSPIPEGGGCRTSLDCPNGTTCTGYVCLAASGLGGACDATHGCAGFLLCRSGTCQASPAESGACEAGGCSNKLGLDCDASSLTCKAVTIAAEGATCGGQVACEAHGTCAQGVCKSAVAEGHPCDASAGPYCEVPSVCIDNWCKVPDAATCP